MGDKPSEFKWSLLHGVDFVGDLYDSKIFIRWYVVKIWWTHNCADFMGMQKMYTEYTPTACMTYIQSVHKHARM